MPRRFLLPILLLLAAVLQLSGCGGGGGGGGTTNLVYSTDWTNYTAATGGQSETVSLFNSSGTQIGGSIILNQGTTTISSTTFSNLATGNYHLQVQLYSTLNGVQVGELDTVISVPTTKTFSTAVGDIVGKLVVSPSTATVPVQQSQQFYVAGYTTAGVATFLPVNSITWSVLGSQGSIDPVAGLFLGLSPGTCSVQASEASTGLNGAASVNVSAVQVVKGDWTILVYMNAANDLSQYSVANFAQMQNAAVAGTNVRTIVQWKQAADLPYPTQFNGTRRYLIQPSTSTGIASQLIQDMGTGIDMGSYQTLTDFINWAKTYYPAQHYALIVWDHGAGWQRSAPVAKPLAVSFDDDTGDSIQTWQLSQGLGNNTFDILAWDASLMQMAEVSDEIRSKVSYIVGSEESPPGAGYPYNLILKNFYQTPTAPTLTLAKGFVDGMITEYADTSYKITQSVIDTSQFPAFITSVNSLGTALTANATALTTDVQNARVNAQSYNLSTVQYYFDLYDLTLKIDSGTTIPAVTAADAQVRTAITNLIPYQQHNSLSPGSHGISIDFSPASVFQSYASDYSQLRFASDTNWATWLSVAP